MQNPDNTPEQDDEEDFEGVYAVDEDTERLLITVVGCIGLLAQSQVNEQARADLEIIADTLVERFMLDTEDIEVEEVIHGDEVLYKPKGGVFGDEPIEPEPEGEAPSGKPS